MSSFQLQVLGIRCWNKGPEPLTLKWEAHGEEMDLAGEKGNGWKRRVKIGILTPFPLAGDDEVAGSNYLTYVVHLATVSQYVSIYLRQTRLCQLQPAFVCDVGQPAIVPGHQHDNLAGGYQLKL